jgi:CheY-like chemotaxis protein
VAEVPRGEDALALVPRLRPDLVLVDLTLAGIGRASRQPAAGQLRRRTRWSS